MDLIVKTQFSDFSVHIDNREYKLHKLILSRIPYLNELFNANPNVKKANLKISPSAFEVIIKWIYSKTPQSVENSEVVNVLLAAKQLSCAEIVAALAAKASVIFECFLSVFNNNCIDVCDWKMIRRICKGQIQDLAGIFPSIDNVEMAGKVLSICNHESMSDVVIMCHKWEQAHGGNKEIWKAITDLELAIHPKQILFISIHDPMLLAKQEVYSKLANVIPLQDSDKLIYKYLLYYDENGVSGKVESTDFHFDPNQIDISVTSEHIKIQVSPQYPLNENSILTVTNTLTNHSLYRWIKPGETYSFHLIISSTRSYSIRIYEKK